MSERAVHTRRSVLAGILTVGVSYAAKSRTGGTGRRLAIIEAPSNLGLRPLRKGHIPGTWQGPQALREAGLIKALAPVSHEQLDRPPYQLDAQPGTRIRNGNTIRRFSEQVAKEVVTLLQSGLFPIVIGGDCSVLLGCLLGARRSGGKGLVHIDGHSDFFHPGNYDAQSRLGTAAGMDLALATGRGEALLTAWPGVDGPLVADEDAIQIGERDAEDPNYAQGYGDILRTPITQITVQKLHRAGVPQTVAQAASRLRERRLDRAWLHVDLDVLDQAVMPAVDSPGTPGFSYAELSELMRGLLATGRFIGANAGIYDPDLDPDRRYARELVSCLQAAFNEL